jgi:hypothetical protein
MPAEHTIRGNRITVTLFGVVTFSDLQAVYAARQSDRAFGEVTSELVDAREATNIRATSDQLRGLEHRLLREHERFRNVPLAIVATAQAVYGTARIFQVIADDDSRPLEIFRSFEKAERWLDQHIPPD